jgi:hypothetical protein
MDDLIAFLRARLDEDEQAAQYVLSFEADGFTWEYQWARFGRHRGRVTRSSFEPGAPSPRRVLAEVEAKRRIVDECERKIRRMRLRVDQNGDDIMSPGMAYLSTTILGPLALPYAEHPDYREEWRPEV